MRSIFLFMMISVDGFFEGPNHDITWHTVDEEFNDFAIKQLEEVDLLLFGRVTYELMASYWPTPDALRDDPQVADLMNKTPKIVISKSLKKADWENANLVHDIDEIRKLKERPGKTIAVFGSSNLCISLIKAGLLDEIRLMVSPTVLGQGTRLFEGLDEKLNLKLTQPKTFKNGNTLLRYDMQG